MEWNIDWDSGHCISRSGTEAFLAFGEMNFTPIIGPYGDSYAEELAILVNTIEREYPAKCVVWGTFTNDRQVGYPAHILSRTKSFVPSWHIRSEIALATNAVELNREWHKLSRDIIRHLPSKTLLSLESPHVVLSDPVEPNTTIVGDLELLVSLSNQVRPKLAA